MTPFLETKNKEFSSEFSQAQQNIHNSDWSLYCSEILFNFADLWHKSFNFYIISPFANVLDEIDIFNFLNRIINNIADIFKYTIFAIISPLKALGSLLKGNLNDSIMSLYQTLQSIEQIILNAIDLAINIIFFVLSPIARIVATPIWYAMTPNDDEPPHNNNPMNF